MCKRVIASLLRLRWFAAAAVERTMALGSGAMPLRLPGMFHYQLALAFFWNHSRLVRTSVIFWY